MTKQEPLVNICNRKYHFNASPVDPNVSLTADQICPPLKEDETVKAEVTAKAARDDAKVAELVGSGVQAVKVVYADGGQHPSFASASRTLDVSRPDALAAGPTEIALKDTGKPKPVIVQVAVAKTAPAAAPVVLAAPAEAAPAPVTASIADEPALVAVAAIPAPPARPVALQAGAAVAVPLAKKPGRQGVEPAREIAAAKPGASPVEPAVPTAGTAQAKSTKSSPFYKRWLGLGEEEVTPGEPLQVNAPAPADVPLPPRRAVLSSPVKPQASLAPSPYGGLPKAILGTQDIAPEGFMAYAP